MMKATLSSSTRGALSAIGAVCAKALLLCAGVVAACAAPAIVNAQAAPATPVPASGGGPASASTSASTSEPTTAPSASVATDDEAPVQTPYWRRAREGWFWQIDPPAPPKPVLPKPVEPKPETAPPKSDRERAQDRDLAALAAFKVNLERALNAATQNPNESNVAQFLELWAQARSKASVFSDVATATAVRMPWIDSTLAGGRPSQPNAMRAFDSIQMQDRDQLLAEMAQSYGLYFFFRRNCAYCHIQAPMLAQFQEKYGFTVYAVSLDGGTLPEFPNAKRDNGLAQKVADAIGVPSQHFVVPAVILAKPATKEVVPVGFGAMNMDEMADRIAMVVRVRDSGAGRGTRSAMTALTGAVPAVANTPGQATDLGMPASSRASRVSSAAVLAAVPAASAAAVPSTVLSTLAPGSTR